MSRDDTRKASTIYHMYSAHQAGSKYPIMSVYILLHVLNAFMSMTFKYAQQSVRNNSDTFLFQSAVAGYTIASSLTTD